jgi:hypothetical protein
MKLAVEITGVHLDDWHYQDEAFPDPERVWATGGGTQTLGFPIPKPVPYNAIAMSGSVPGGVRLKPLVLSKLGFKPMKGSLRRSGKWRTNDGNPRDTEGSCDAPPSKSPGTRSRRARRCGATSGRRSKSASRAGVGPEFLTVGFLPVPDLAAPWKSCPPDIDGITRPLRLTQPRAVLIPSGIGRVAALRRGGSVTLKGSAELGYAEGSEAKRCPQLAGVGMRSAEPPTSPSRSGGCASGAGRGRPGLSRRWCGRRGSGIRRPRGRLSVSRDPIRWR